MASSRPKRPKGPPPRLNLEEMEQDPSMKGMLSFLEVSPGEKLEMLRRRSEVDATSVIPFPAPPSAAAPNIGAPELRGLEVGGAPPATSKYSAPEVGAPSFGAPNFGALKLDAPEVVDGKGPDVGNSMAPKLGAATFGAPELQGVYVYRPNRPTARPATTAQDGHTHGEQALFATLWRLARQSSQGTFRVISIGERTLASEVPMAYSTVQENLRSLAAKLAIEVRTNGPRQPKAYIVYPY
jgi:hypothetical protein